MKRLQVMWDVVKHCFWLCRVVWRLKKNPIAVSFSVKYEDETAHLEFRPGENGWDVTIFSTRVLKQWG